MLLDGKNSLQFTSGDIYWGGQLVNKDFAEPPAANGAHKDKSFCVQHLEDDIPKVT